MTGSSNRPVVLVAGATASGKSRHALRLASERGGVVINADALQVYRELRILSARPAAEDEATVAHRLYGHVSGAEAYSVARWLEEARAEIEAAWGAGRVPIVTGGTGLYFKTLVNGLADVPKISAEVREKWRSFGGDLHAELARRDPTGAVRLPPADRQRVLRALEVIDQTGQPLWHWHKVAHSQAVLAGAEVERLFLAVPRETLVARAEARFDAMIEAGALDEVRAVLGYDPRLPMMKAIGVPELSRYLRGEIALDEAVTLAKAATRQYIKRQQTWWRGQMAEWQVSAATP